MTTIALYAYHKQIEQLLEEGQIDLAVEHCRQILQQKPQHIATYRLLAKGLLEAGDYRGAKDLFQRVLSADPNDYIAHVGLADIYREEDVTPQAIWHLERAYEIEPYNAAIQQELRVLYLEHVKSQRNGRSGDSRLPVLNNLPLTDGAVARLYLRSEMYEQAIDLLRTALAEDDERVDLRVLLLEALWRDGQRMEAVNTCLQILDLLPNCIAANAILAEIWLRIGRIDEAREYLHRVETLVLPDASQFDGDSLTGYAFRAEGAPPLPDQVLLTYLGDPGSKLEEDSSAPVLRVVQPSELPGPEAAGEAPADEDLFGWLDGLTGALPPVAETDQKTAVSGLLAADWLDDLTATDEAAEEPQEERSSATGSLDDDLEDLRGLDWLSSELELPVATSRDQVDEDEEPDWLADLAGNELEPIQLDSATAASWLVEEEAPQKDKADSDPDWPDFLGEELLDETGHEAGKLDVSQFFALDERETEPAAKFEWRLTDELELKNVADATDEPTVARSGEETDAETEAPTAADIPDWLVSSMQLEEIDDEHEHLAAEIAEELADWVATQNAGLDLEPPQLVGEGEEEEEEETAVPGLLHTPNEPDVDKDESAPLETGDLPDWLRGDALDLPDSSLLGETVTEKPPAEEPAEWLAVASSAMLAGWLADEASDKEEDEIAETFVEASVDLEEVVSDDKEDKGIEPQEEADEWSGDMADSLDWLDDLTTMAQAGADEESLFAVADGLPDWLHEEEPLDSDPELAADTPVDLEETAVSDENLDWLDALAPTGAIENVDEQPTWQWPEQESEPETHLEVEAAHGEQDEQADTEEELEEFFFATAEPLEPAEADIPDDLDDAMSWLEKLAGEPDAPVEELPSVAAQLDQEEAEFPEPALAFSDPMLDTLDDLDDLDDIGLPPEDPEAAMAWLEQLAARQGAPLDELPSVGDVALGDADLAAETAFPDAEPDAEPELHEEEEFSLSDFFADAEEQTELEPFDEAMDWLTDLTGDETLTEAETLSEEETWFDFAATEAEVEATTALTSPDDKLLAELDWLETVSGTGAALSADELDEVEVDEAELAAALDLLEAMASQPPPAAPDVSAATALPADDDLLPDETWADFWDEPEGEERTDLGADALADLFAADDLDTLDDLFVSEAEMAAPAMPTDMAELVTAEAEPDWEADLLDGIPEDPDAAMAWLEQLAARQGAPLDELPSLSDEESPLLLRAEEETVGFVADVTQETAVPTDDLPEDIEDVMAWLEQLAARQGASLDELPSVTDADQEIVTPAWIAAAQAAGEAEGTAEADDWEEIDEIDPLAFADILFVPETESGIEEATAVADSLDSSSTETDETQADEDGEESEQDFAWPTISTDELSQELAASDALPDWLDPAVGEEEDPILGHTDWLEALPEPDLDSWLAAEEEATGAGGEMDFAAAYLTPPPGDTDSLRESDTGPFVDAEPEETDEDLLAPDLDFGFSAPEPDEARLSAAQQALAEGELGAALENYTALVETGEGLNTIIADLEVAVRQHQAQPLLRRTLGDAYMRNGQLQKALETYRQALDQL